MIRPHSKPETGQATWAVGIGICVVAGLISLPVLASWRKTCSITPSMARESTLAQARSCCSMARLNLGRARHAEVLADLTGRWLPLCELLEKHRDATGIELSDPYLNGHCHEYAVYLSEHETLVRDKLMERVKREEKAAFAAARWNPLKWFEP